MSIAATRALLGFSCKKQSVQVYIVAEEHHYTYNNNAHCFEVTNKPDDIKRLLNSLVCSQLAHDWYQSDELRWKRLKKKMCENAVQRNSFEMNEVFCLHRDDRHTRAYTTSNKSHKYVSVHAAPRGAVRTQKQNQINIYGDVETAHCTRSQ